MTATALAESIDPLADEHSVLLWQTCAYADDLNKAIRSTRRLTTAFDSMLEFLHYRLLPYLNNEERELSAARLRDEHMTRLLLADHDRLRADVENLESSPTRSLVGLATDVLVDRLDRHVCREETWVYAAAPRDTGDVEAWALPLLLSDDIDIDSLPMEHRDTLVLQRLTRMRAHETVRLHASHDLHPLWRRQHAGDRNSHVWIYEQDGPSDWLARITRRDREDL